MRAMKLIGAVATAALMGGLAGTVLAAPTITAIPAPSGFTRITSAKLSAAGGHIIGTCDSGAGTPTRAFMWTQSGGSVVLDIPAPGGQTVTSSLGVDISADGSVVLASVVSSAGTQSVRWTSGGGSVALQAPMFAIAVGGLALSGDGQTIVGQFFNSGPGQSNRPRPAKWNAAGVVTQLDPPLGLTSAFCSSVSDAGDVIAGGAAPLNSPPAGALWAGGRVDRLTRPQGPGSFFIDSGVGDVSGDGRFMVGSAPATDIFGTPIGGMFRWSTAAGAQPQFIAKIPSSRGISGRTTNANASIIGGTLFYRETVPAPMPGQFIEVDVDRAMMWSSADGPRLLQDLLTTQGATLGDWNFQSVADMSGTGNVLLTLAATTPRGAGQYVLVSDVLTQAQCTLSDVAGANQSAGPSGSLTADDIIVFLGWYFAGDARADIAGPNQSTTRDNQRTADDIIVFLSRYFAGC